LLVTIFFFHNNAQKFYVSNNVDST